MRRPTIYLLLATAVSAQPAFAQADTVFHSVVFSAKTVSGAQKTWKDKDGVHLSYEYNDRGRGPKITEDVRLDEAGFPVSALLRGHSYFKIPVHETFKLEGGKATWEGSAERGSVSGTRAFYLSFDGVPGELGLLANALLKSPSKSVSLLPAGEASIERAGERSLSSAGKTVRVTQYLISGTGFTPQPLWLDDQGELFAVGSTWTMTIRKGWESFIADLAKAQDSVAELRSRRIAKELRRKPAGAVVFRNARLFDSDAGTLHDNTSVVVVGNRITAVGPTASISTPANAEIIEVKGKTLMPGLWDMHVHIDDTDGLQHIAAGVTTVRDMANDTDELIQRKKRFDEGSLVGPHIVMAGFMDGSGPFAGPTKVLVDTEEQVRAAVKKYSELGYVQIKIYSSIKPELVPAIIDEAHKRGLKVSGHVPAYMTAEQFVKLGGDELQHLNFLFLNFWGDTIKDTRTPLRFTAVAERAAALDLQSERVRAFVALLKEHRVVVDPTVNIFEGMFAARQGVVYPGYESVADRLPPVVRRGFLGGGLPVPEGKDSLYRAAVPAMLRMVKMLYDAGVPIVAGTDAPAGFALHHELELYSAAGIPNADVLRIATIGAARVLGMDKETGSIKVGKIADLIIVNGDPLKTISDIRRVELTMKDGVIHESAKVYRALGVKPVE
jgi:imidazolonepropionase-like amidohydrolase